MVVIKWFMDSLTPIYKYKCRFLSFLFIIAHTVWLFFYAFYFYFFIFDSLPSTEQNLSTCLSSITVVYPIGIIFIIIYSQKVLLDGCNHKWKLSGVVHTVYLLIINLLKYIQMDKQTNCFDIYNIIIQLNYSNIINW